MVVIHIALQKHDLVFQVVADSFDVRTLHYELIKQRTEAVKSIDISMGGG